MGRMAVDKAEIIANCNRAKREAVILCERAQYAKRRAVLTVAEAHKCQALTRIEIMLRKK